MSRQRPRTESSPPWYSHLNIDLLHKVLHRTILHPIISMFLPLCFLAQSYRLHHAPVYWSMVYSFAVNVYFFANLLNRRLAFGTKREFDWTEEVVLITGGASGLGLIIAEVYGMRGVSVAVLDKVVPEGAEDETRGVRFWKCDVGSPEEVERVKREVEEELGTVTVLINNAAVVRGKPLLELSAEEVISSYNTNILAHYHTLRAFLPGMVKLGKGSIVTISSTLATLPAARTTLYAPAKAAATALHHALTAELKEYSDIKTLLVTPGQMSTPLFEGVRTPSSVFAPVLEPVDVAKEILAAIEGGLGGEVAMPLYSGWIGVMAVLPYSLQKLLRWWSGADEAMVGFRGGKKEV